MPNVIHDEKILISTIEKICAAKVAPCIICIYGGPASGKTTLTNRLQETFPNSVVMGTDDFALGTRAYRHEHLEGKVRPPEKYDTALMNELITRLKNMASGETVRLPRYSEHTGEAVCVGYDNFPAAVEQRPDFIFIEGDFDFLDATNRPQVSIFLDVPDDERLRRRIERDTKYRNASEAAVRKSFATRQETQFIPYTLPLKNTADIIYTSF